MIFDSEDAFPNSVVVYVRFRNYHLRQMFAYLREKELLYQDDLRRYAGTKKEFDVRARLEEVEAQLIWMAHNVPAQSEKATKQLELLI